MIKKIVLIIFTLSLIVLFGCKQGGNELESFNPTKTPGPTPVSKPEIIKIYTYIDKWPEEVKSAGSSAGYDNWKELIKNEFGINVELGLVDYASPWQYENYVILLFAEKNNNDEEIKMDGVYLVHPFYIQYLSRNELILPIEGYISDNGTWNKMNEDLKEIVNIEGSYWGIPKETSTGQDIQLRAYKTSWMDTINLRKPGSISELYDACMFATYNDPDGDGIDNTFGMSCNYLYNCGDIFESFGIPWSKNPIARALSYDTEIQAWRPMLTSDSITDCLEWLKMCYDNGLFGDSFCNSGLESASSFNYFFEEDAYSTSDFLSFFTRANKKGIMLDYSVILDNPGYNSVNQVWPTETYYYVLGADVNEPKDTINWFLNVFYGNEEGYLTGKLGGYENLEKHNQQKTVTLMSETVMPRIFLTNEIYSNYEYIVGSDDDLPWELQFEMIQTQIFNNAQVDQIFKVPLIDVINMEAILGKANSPDKWFTYGNYVENIIIDTIKGNISVIDMIQDHKEQFSLMGIDKRFNELNEYIGENKSLPIY